VRELLKREIGEAVRREFNVSEAGLITVNDVDPAGDLKSAVVFVSILGNPSQQKRGLQLLHEHRIRLQALVARAVVLKYTTRSSAATKFCKSSKNWKKPPLPAKARLPREKSSQSHRPDH
jgi:hypothetical protein